MKTAYIKYSPQPFLFPLGKGQLRSWYNELKLLDISAGFEGPLYDTIGYSSEEGSPEADVGNLISYADVRTPKKAEHDSVWPYVFDHEFLYLSREYREKTVKQYVEPLTVSLGYDPSKTYIDPRPTLAEYAIKPRELVSILKAQMEDPEKNILARSNEFYLKAKKGFKFRISVGYQRATAKVYKTAQLHFHFPLEHDACDSWHNSLEGKRVFFACGKYEFKQ